jgi:transposase
MSRFDISDFEWQFIAPILPNKSRGVARVDDRRVLSGIFYALRAGCPWRDLPGRYGPYTTVYNRFNRWSKAGVWDHIMDAVIDAHNGDVVMIDGTSVRVYHSAVTLKKATQIDVWVAHGAD